MASHSIDAITNSKFVYYRLCCRYSIPESLRTHHGSGFHNEIMENLTKLLQVHQHRTTSYYPQSNGLVERIVQTFKHCLKRTIMDQLHGSKSLDGKSSPYWTHLVDSVLDAYNSTPHTTIGMSPDMLLYGRQLRLTGDVVEDIAIISVDYKSAVLQHLRYFTDVIPTLRHLAPPKDTPVPAVPFKVKDRVWVHDSHYDVGFAPVFAPNWKGPYIVKECLKKNAYWLRTELLIYGKCSTTLEFPINRVRLKLVTAQELQVVVDKAQTAVLDKAEEDSWSFVLALLVLVVLSYSLLSPVLCPLPSLRLHRF